MLVNEVENNFHHIISYKERRKRVVKTQYIDTELLKTYIKNSKYKIGYIVKELGISRQSFDRKRKGITPFIAAEVFVLCALLEISDEDKAKIFAMR